MCAQHINDSYSIYLKRYVMKKRRQAYVCAAAAIRIGKVLENSFHSAAYSVYIYRMYVARIFSEEPPTIFYIQFPSTVKFNAWLAVCNILCGSMAVFG